MILTQEQQTAVLRTLYIQGAQSINWTAINDLRAAVMLITASCGRGKTSYALDLTDSGLLADVNRAQMRLWLPGVEARPQEIQPEQVLFLTSRRAIKCQQQRKETVVCAAVDDFQAHSGYSFLDEENRKGKIRITTAHQFGAWIKAGLVETTPRLIILDELHSLFSETIFADDLSYTLEYIKEHYAELVKIGLTATPEFLLNYIQDDTLKFQIIDFDLGAKYKAQNISCYTHTKAATVFEKQVKPHIDKHNKAIYYTMSARQCYFMSLQYGERAAFLISDYNDCKTDSGEYLRDIMRKQGVKEYILEHERFPDDIDVIFINSACREGLNIEDENVKTVICEAVDLITIEQIFGRIRKDIDNFMVVCNFNNCSTNKRNIEKFIELLEDISNSEDEQAALSHYHGRQQENPKLQKFVYQYKGRYYLNKYAKAYLQYIDESYVQLANRKSNRVVSVGDREMLLKDEYFQLLSKFAETGKINVFDVKDVADKSTIDLFREIEKEYLNKPIGTQEKKALAARLCAVKANRKPGSWTTVKRVLEQNGYKIEDKHTKTSRYTVISKA